MLSSPYSPGAAPTFLSGRREQLDSAQAELGLVATYARFVGRIRVEVGQRGVGKTSLLRAVRAQAEEAGFVTAWVTARADERLVGALVHALGEGLATIGVDVGRHRGLRERVRRLTVELGAGPAKAGVELDVSAEQGTAPASSAAFGGFVSEAALAARERGSAGLCLLVDEIQAARVPDLRTLAYAWQELQTAVPEPPAVLFAAGLPDSPDVLTRAVTFSERFGFRPLDRLDPDDARRALLAPADSVGVGWDERLLAEVLRRAEGYPYFLQLWGDAVWRASVPEAGGVLDESALAVAETGVRAEQQTMFRARWAKATPAEQRVLAAIAALEEDDGAGVRRSAVAERLGVGSNDLSEPRRRLLDKGLIEAPGRGRLAFTTPGFAAFVREETE
ncbi:hypothetical protein GCM10011519_30600 [Marmoricola endophyticus]|uniref:ATP-binding protein n=1 Tax=Marmoricola endophyticus TaxID=2040280 RepID=A0A917BS14_9ACTN|nr:ATP-binding protein [Marmoricola endophyticus]GGF54571.1 hypothetical protein GCM10011519_30600 [Marmoricola endophyticus]